MNVNMENSVNAFNALYQFLKITENERLSWDMCNVDVSPEFATHIYYDVIGYHFTSFD